MSFTKTPTESLPAGINDMLQKTKGNLFFRRGAGFLGPLMARVECMWTRDIPTACISTKVLYWNPDFFMRLNKDSRVTVLAHELWHNGFLHGVRLKERCPDIWNQAADHVINLLLKEHGYYMDGFPYIMDPKFVSMSTDEVYDLLIAPGQPNSGPGVPPGEGMEGDILPTEAKDVAIAIANVVGAVTTANMTRSSSSLPGTIPGEITLILEAFLHPKLPWEKLLFRFFNSLVDHEYSYAKPNRRYQDPIMRGATGRNGLDHLMYFVDISGSITDEQILAMNSEVKFIQEELRPERLSLITFDTELHDFYEFAREDAFEKITIEGRGGTSLDKVFAHALKENPTAVVIFTDLYVAIPEEPLPMPILWVCTDRIEATVPYGQLIYLDTVS